MNRDSILPRLIGSLLGFLALVSIAFAYGLVAIDERRQMGSLEARATATAHRLAATLAYPVWKVLVREIDDQIQSAMDDPSLFGVELALAGNKAPARAWSRDSDWSPLYTVPVEAPGLIDRTQDIRYGGESVATMKLLFTGKFVDQEILREALLSGALVLAEALSLALGLYFILRSSIFRPLREIEGWASEASLGKRLPLPLASRARGEIASLRSSIGRMTSLLGVRYDALAEAERETKAALAQKEVLIKELFHRTRNSLQVLSSMIGLREGRVDDEVARSELRGILDRVFSISLAQEELYNRDDLSFVDLGSYLRTLVERLVNEDMDHKGRVRAAIETESVSVILDVALPLGLAVTELVANSLGHAFPDDRGGIVSLGLKALGDGSVLVSIGDDGVGPPPGFDPERDAKLGLGTASSLIRRQIKGALSYDFSSGFACSILFAATGPGISRRI